MLMPMFVMFVVCYLLGSLLLWAILKQITQKFHFRQQPTSDKPRAARGTPASAVVISVMIGGIFALPFIPAHPAPNIDN